MDDLILDNQARREIPVEYNNKPDPGWKRFFRTNKAAIWSVVVAIILIGGVFWYFFSRHAVTPNLTSTNVILQIKGPSTMTSGNEAEYTVIYRNGENADLVNVSLDMLFPSGFTFKSATPAATSSSGQNFNLPLIKQGEDGQLVIRGKLSGATGEDKEIKAQLHYKLSNFNSEFEVEQSYHTNILPPDLTMDINGPVQVVNGQDTTFTVNFTNVTSQDYDNLGVQLTYPAGFSFTSSSTPPAKDNNYWKLPTLPSGSSGSLEITGSFAGDTSASMLVRADLGQILNNVFSPQITATANFQIIASSLSVSISADKTDYIKLGDSIGYTVKYTNQGNIGLSNLVITANLSGVIVDLSHVSAQDAIVTGSTITWKAATLPSLNVLSPNESGEVHFTVPVKQTLTTNLKNQSITASVSVTSDEITKPTKSAPLEIKLISKLALDVSGNYISGAAPMQVGQPTIIAMTFVLSNLSNDLSNVEVVASLPLPSSAWNNVIVPQSESSRLSFDPNSGKIKWHLGDIPAFTGKFTPAQTVTFQLQITPSESDQGKTMSLLKNISAAGTDTYINQSISSETVPEVTVNTIDDDVLNTKGTTVQ
jgi:uncharacterized repeat protein (TIGR01451 family)